MLKRLSSAEVQALDPKDLEAYQLKLMEEDSFDVTEILEKNPPKPNGGSIDILRPALVDKEDPTKGWTVYGLFSNEFSKLEEVTLDDIIKNVKARIESPEGMLCEVGARPPIDKEKYQATANGVKGYKQLIVAHFNNREARIGCRVIDIRLGRSGIHVTFIPEGDKAELVEKWIKDPKVSLRMYPRFGYNTKLEQEFITFDLDKEILLP